MAELASLNLKVSPKLKAEFVKTAEALGMPASTALKVLVTRFVMEGGFPFDVRIPKPSLNWDDPRIIQTYKRDGRTMMPASWRDGEDDDE